MQCRPGCAACCTVISISSPLPGMPEGKPAGVHCVNLDDANCCTIWNSELYPAVCRGFQATRDFCGHSNEEARQIIAQLEELTGATFGVGAETLEEGQRDCSVLTPEDSYHTSS